MCEALSKAEKAGNKPMIEGELPDMPEGSADEDFEESATKGKRGGKGKKKGSSTVNDEETKAAEILKAKL